MMPKNKDKEKELQDIYNKIFAESIKHMKKYEPQMVAGTLMAIAIRLYKTNLSDDGFSEMLQTILDSEGDIKSYVDIFSNHVDKTDKDSAMDFLTTDSFHLRMICELAGRDAGYVRGKIRAKLLDE